MELATKKQVEAVQRIINNNPSLSWDGSFGYYSNGWVVINVSSKHDLEKTYKITLTKDGIEI